MDPLALIEAHAEELCALGARRIGVFGSFAKNQATPESDVDVYIEFSEGHISFESFIRDEIKKREFVRRIEVIGEAAKKIRDEIRDQIPEIEWKKISPFLLTSLAYSPGRAPPAESSGRSASRS